MQRPGPTPRPVAPLAAVLLTLLAVAACGGSTAGPAASPTPSPPGLLTEADAGQTVGVARGSVVHVALHAPAGWANWSHPVSADPSILAPTVEPAAAATIGTTLAAFQAVGSGSTRLTSATTPLCSPYQACPAIARGWGVTVRVS